jgi:chemotaxis signal transduction protein
MRTISSKFSQRDFRFVRFSLGEAEFGIDIRHVKEVVRHEGIIRPERLPSFVEGLIPVRGQDIPVVDLRKRLSMAGVLSDSAMIIICSVSGRIVGLIVDRVLDMTAGSLKARFKPINPMNMEWMHAYGPHNPEMIDVVLESGQKNTVLLLKPSALFDERELRDLSLPYIA